MGLTQSNSNAYLQKNEKKYSDEDIKNNIIQLFKNNKDNMLSEASYTVRDLGDLVVSDTENKMQYKENKLIGGSSKTFNPDKKRYLQYDIDKLINNLQQGGSLDLNGDDYREISDMSEFEKIKNILMNNQTGQSNQNGGNIDIDNDFESLIKSIASPVTTEDNKFNFLDILKGGANREDDEEETIEFDEDDEDDDDGNDEEIDDDDNDDDDEEIEDDDDDDLETLESDDDDTQKNKDKRKSLDSDNDNQEFSETSVRTSDLNIVPFYSSDASSEKHPYVKNRFN